MGNSNQPADPLTADEEVDPLMVDEEADSWTADEDRILTEYVQSHVFSTWSGVPEGTGLVKSGKSCFLRWLNHLCPVKTRLPVPEQNFAILLNQTGFLRFDHISRRFGRDLYDDVAYFWLSYMNDTILPSGIEHKAVGETEQYSTELKLSSSGNKRDANCMEINHTNVGPIQSNPIQPTPENGLHMVNKDIIQTDSSENSCTARNDSRANYGPNDGQNYNYTSLDTTHLMKMPNCIKDLLLSADATENERDDKTCIIEQFDTNVGHRYTTAVSSMPQDDFHIQNNCFLQVDYPGNIDTTHYDQCDDHDEEDDDQNNIPGYITTKICISLEDLKKHFHMNLEDAAKNLNVSRSSLKRICREYGIERWPCRKRKISHQKYATPKNTSSDRRKRSTRIQPKITPLGNASRRSNNYVLIKATYGDDIIKFRLSVYAGLNELREKIGTRLELELGSFRLKYKDNAGDLVLITCDEDLHYCLEGISVSTSIDHETTFDISVFPLSNYKG